MIAHMDCTAGNNNELCNSNGVDGFPTLNIYKDGVKVCDDDNGSRQFSLLKIRFKVEEYNASRDLVQLQESKSRRNREKQL